jgi:hypothetical protein
LQSSTGSLLVGLSFEERQEIVLLVLIAQTNPAKHPDYHSNWLHNIADEALDYSSPFGKMEYIRSLQGKSEHAKEKFFFDYSYLLERCGDMEAQYVLMMEDDTIAAKGWNGRTMKRLESAARKTEGRGYNPQDCELANYSYDFQLLHCRMPCTCKKVHWNFEKSVVNAFSTSCIIFYLLISVSENSVD